VSVADVSEVATRFAVNRQLAKGQEVELTFTVPFQRRPLKRRAKIMRCDARDETTFWVVATFDRHLDYSDIQDLT
jgi:hypothetical protein